MLQQIFGDRFTKGSADIPTTQSCCMPPLIYHLPNILSRILNDEHGVYITPKTSEVELHFQSLPPPSKKACQYAKTAAANSLIGNSDKPLRGSSSPHHLHAVGIKMFLAAAPKYFQRPLFFYAPMFIKSGRSSCLLKAQYVRFGSV